MRVARSVWKLSLPTPFLLELIDLFFLRRSYLSWYTFEQNEASNQMKSTDKKDYFSDERSEELVFDKT